MRAGHASYRYRSCECSAHPIISYRACFHIRNLHYMAMVLGQLACPGVCEVRYVIAIVDLWTRQAGQELGKKDSTYYIHTSEPTYLPPATDCRPWRRYSSLHTPLLPFFFLPPPSSWPLELHVLSSQQSTIIILPGVVQYYSFSQECACEPTNHYNATR
jgi:hypothetical protein